MTVADATHSCVAYMDVDGKSIVIKAKDGNHTMPSHVAFVRSGRVVGSAAKTDVRRPSHLAAVSVTFSFPADCAVGHAPCCAWQHIIAIGQVIHPGN